MVVELKGGGKVGKERMKKNEIRERERESYKMWPARDINRVRRKG